MIVSKKYAMVLLGLGLTVATANAFAYTGHKLAGKAKVSMAEARAIALKAHPGIITDTELEKEKGGSGLRYSFDIRDGKATVEVGVDATSGEVLENGTSGPNAE